MKTFFEKIQSGKTYVIAEIGANFDGSLDRAKKLIDLAKECGADCAKFQSFKTEKILNPIGFKNKISYHAKWDKSVEQVFKESELPREWHNILADYCKEKEIDFSSAPYDEEAVDILAKLDIPFIKIGSGEITHPQFLRYVAKKGIPILLSVGGSTMNEIEEAINIISPPVICGDLTVSKKFQIVLLQCVVGYPSPLEDANVRAMKTLKDTFGLWVGYSDHTPSYTVPLVAVSLGAKVIEKHFTDDKTREGADHHFALEPKEFKEMVRKIRLTEKVLGSNKREVYPSEAETIIVQRRSVYAKRDINKSEIILREMLDILRPSPPGTLLPKFIRQVIGKKSQRNYKKGEPIHTSEGLEYEFN